MQPPRPPDTFSGQRHVNQPQETEFQQHADFDEQAPQQDEIENPEMGEKPSRLPSILALCLAIVAVVFLLRYKVFTVSNLRIDGIRHVSWTTVAKASGLDRGTLFFLVKEDAVREGINANRYLVYLGMEKIFPNTIEIKVYERQPTAFFTHLGMGYVLSEDAVILEETKDLQTGNSLIGISGLSVWGQPMVGTKPYSTDPSQVEVLEELLREIKGWGFEQDVKSIDIAQGMNLTFLTKDAYTIHLGNAEYLHAKVGTVQSVIRERRRQQQPGGIIEAAKPGEATYRQANQ